MHWKCCISTIQTRHYLGKKPWTSHPTNYKLNRTTQISSQNIYHIYKYGAKHLFSEKLFRQETSDKSSVLGKEKIWSLIHSEKLFRQETSDQWYDEYLEVKYMNKKKTNYYFVPLANLIPLPHFTYSASLFCYD